KSSTSGWVPSRLLRSLARMLALADMSLALQMLFRQFVQRARLRFRGGVVLRPGADVLGQATQTGGEEAEHAVKQRRGVEQSPALPDQALGGGVLAALAAHDAVRVAGLLDVLLAQAAQQRGDRNLHRADLAAGA